MLSYQHAYHAGGPADVHKHAALAAMLALLTRKGRGISYAETHAGRGLYDLDGPEAARTGEAAAGIGQAEADPASPYGEALAMVRAEFGPRFYPGSPVIAWAFLRPQDRMTLMELHPAEHAALHETMAGSGASIHHREGFERLLALAPLSPRRGLVLVDPSYEVKTEYADAARFALRLAAKWPQAAIMIWYPVLPAGRHAELLAGIAPLRPLVNEVTFRHPPSRGMTGSGLAIANGPYGAREALDAAMTAGTGIFA
ncbi:23S rRNA (adenine(2030)-N(6))-methyltransferase RlmJ [Amaricoccus sp.]|uniref:23S rRNA (adenine(2030)-N(6))-methyltransferase RlmJ n=1 Tax=Amaricoccus sp. TaxID=1872485 RepID=UPI001B59CF86|nr:23S rRNA (adenine(2030)-N(6))-methyltransferase RlmJ [Amaricoccus sp.]MBP7240779.1 23S rRNA (adenine(2030)-N(6))-methyltransferase RlmJ [Amaricoccus sp.]